MSLSRFESLQRKQTWQVRRDMDFDEAQRLAILKQKPAPNPPHLTRPVKVKVLKGFIGAGRALVPGEIAVIDFSTARDMIFLKRAELCEGETL